MNYLITGGAGFIGCNYANRLIKRGEKVVLYDNLSRAGAEKNLEWLSFMHGKNSFSFIKGDIRDQNLFYKATLGMQVVIHLAAQVAVTTSVDDPQNDFEVNAWGTLNVLEALRKNGDKPIVIYSSTNKVYGELGDLEIINGGSRYDFRDYPHGISEQRCLDFHSPYGCSKGCGDQYVRDYYRIYDIPTIVFRQSCIYGPRQFGIEDQGWVAWFIIAILKNHPITIYGDGMQMRDLLYVDDLLDAYDLAISKINISKGNIYNIGGGEKNTVSIWTEFSKILESICGKKIEVNQNDWRPGDQLVYVSDILKIQNELGWAPKVGVSDGVSRLYKWAEKNIVLFA